jgi:tetratricopeptide (TPR) repeat protein
MRTLKTIALFSAASAALSLAACDSAPIATNAGVEQAMETGDLASAQARLSDIFNSGNADDETQRLKLDLMLKLGDGYAAMAAIDALSEAALPAPERRVTSAHALILQEKPEAASALYAEADPANFSEQDYHMLLWALREMGEDEDFDAGLQAGLAAFPDSADLNTLAARALMSVGENERARPYAEKALASDPAHFEALLAQGELAIEAGDLDAALDHYRAAVKAYPWRAIPKANVAGLQLDLEQVEAAGETLRAALAKHPEEPFLQWQQVRYALATDDLDTARLALENARKAFRGEDEFTLLSAQAEERFGNRELALSEYRRYLKAVGDDAAIEAKLAELEAGA